MKNTTKPLIAIAIVATFFIALGVMATRTKEEPQLDSIDLVPLETEIANLKTRIRSLENGVYYLQAPDGEIQTVYLNTIISSIVDSRIATSTNE